MARTRRFAAGERGQVAPLVAVILVAAGFLCVVVTRFGAAAMDRAEARTAADAAALAGAAAGRGAADEIVAANGGAIVRYEAGGREVRVRAREQHAAATAKARREAGDGQPPGAAPALRGVLARAAQLLGREVPVRAVRDGGLAVDVAPEIVESLRAVAARAGLCQPSPAERPTYFEVCPAPVGETGSVR